MNFHGIAIGFSAFFIIGIFHPIVIKSEYYFGRKSWPFFLIFGVLALMISFFIENITISSIIGILGFSSLWAIHEIFEQEQRVKKGWFPNNLNKR